MRHGRTIFHSGAAADEGQGPVDPGAHFYRSLLLDEHGNAINKRNAWAARSVAYVRLIPPGAADTIHYRLDIPEDAGAKITLRAKVNYRKFAWWNTQFAYAGVRDPADKNAGGRSGVRRWEVGVHRGHLAACPGGIKAIPDIPTTVMAERVGGADGAAARRGAAGVGAADEPAGPRALERLRHRPAAAGRHQERREPRS